MPFGETSLRKCYRDGGLMTKGLCCFYPHKSSHLELKAQSCSGEGSIAGLGLDDSG